MNPCRVTPEVELAPELKRDERVWVAAEYPVAVEVKVRRDPPLVVVVMVEEPVRARLANMPLVRVEEVQVKAGWTVDWTVKSVSSPAGMVRVRGLVGLVN